MQSNNIHNHKERLKAIIDQAYILLCNKIAGKEIVVNNEASMQLQLGSLIKSLGVLYEFSSIDRFHIELETPESISETAKSKKGARCDIKIAFFEGRQKSPKAQAFIELKYFKIPSADSSTEATTDNRFGVLMDIENLERYQEELRAGNSIKPLCYEIVFAENSTYYSAKRATGYDIGDNITSESSYSYCGKTVCLKHKYTFHWDKYSDTQYCLKIKI